MGTDSETAVTLPDLLAFEMCFVPVIEEGWRRTLAHHWVEEFLVAVVLAKWGGRGR